MKKLLVGAFLVTLVAPVPARAQDGPVQVNIGGGFTSPLSDVSERFGTGGGFAFGVTFQPSTSPVGFQFQYGFNRLAGEDKIIPTYPSAPPGAPATGQALIESHHSMHSLDFNAIFKAPGRARVSPYGLAGGGVYYRSVSLTTPDVGFTTWCDPYWYVCYPALVPVDRIIGDRSSWDPGLTFGGGINFAMGESAQFYVEMRYQYMWGPEFTDGQGVTQKANGQYLPVTFGFRF